MYYGLNLRGSNFLILRARLHGKNERISELHREEVSIPSNVMGGTSQVNFTGLILHQEASSKKRVTRVICFTKPHMQITLWIFASDKYASSLQELFDYIALQLAMFISEQGANSNDTPEKHKVLGFIVSYPVDQAAASSGAAIKWKSFSVTDTVEFVFSSSEFSFF